MELTIEQIIKIIIIVLVITVVVLGAYFAFRNYIIPYFKGISFKLALNLVRR